MTLFHRAAAASAILVLLTMGPVATSNALADSDFLPTDRQCAKLENPDAATKGWCAAINRRKRHYMDLAKARNGDGLRSGA